MTVTNWPNTLAIAQAIQGFCQALTYQDNVTVVYDVVQLGEIKDITVKIAESKVCLEIYANTDDSQHLAFGGKITDEQTWFLLSLVSIDDSAAAEELIYNVRDALVRPFQIHATLNNAGSVFHSQVKPTGAKFIKIFRNGQWVRAHLFELMTRQEWFVPTPPGVIA